MLKYVMDKNLRTTRHVLRMTAFCGSVYVEVAEARVECVWDYACCRENDWDSLYVMNVPLSFYFNLRICILGSFICVIIIIVNNDRVRILYAR